MWAGEHDRRVNSSPSDDSSVFRILFPWSEEKHIRRYAESNKLRSFRSSDGMNSTWACKSKSFFFIKHPIIFKECMWPESFWCALFSLHAAPHLVPNRISFISEDFETSNPFSCCLFCIDLHVNSIMLHISSCLFYATHSYTVSALSNKSSIRFSIIHFSRWFRQAFFILMIINEGEKSTERSEQCCFNLKDFSRKLIKEHRRL